MGRPGPAGASEKTPCQSERWLCFPGAVRHTFQGALSCTALGTLFLWGPVRGGIPRRMRPTLGLGAESWQVGEGVLGRGWGGRFNH